MNSLPFSIFTRDTLQLSIGLGLYVLLVITALVYWPGLDGGFMLDDYENLRLLHDFDLGALTWREASLSNHSGPTGRPITMLTFVANVALSGQDVRALKQTNLMIHLLCGVLIFWLAGRLFHTLLPNYREWQRWALGLAVASLWLLSPLLVSTTLYVIQRLTQLATLFLFAGLISYTIGRQNLDTQPRLGWSLIAACLALWLPLATFSKENGALLPLLMLVIEIFVFRFQGQPRTRRSLRLVMVLAVALPAIAALAALATTHTYLLNYTHRPFTAGERLLTEARVLFYYIGNLIIPQGPGMGLYHDDFPLSRGLFSPATTFIAVLGWILALVLVYVTRIRWWWPLFLGPCFFLAGHALESTIFPLELIFEHRNYLPAFGIFFSIVYGLALLAERTRKPAPVILLLTLLPVVYGFATYQRATVWSSWVDILLTAEKTHPSSMRVHIELAGLYILNGDKDSALDHLDRVEKLRESAAPAVALHRLLVYCKTRQPIPDNLYGQMPDTMPRDDASIYAINVFRSLATETAAGKCPTLDLQRFLPNAERLIGNTYTKGPKHDLWDLNYHMAYFYQAAGRLDDAIRHLELADANDPSRPEALLTAMQYQLSARNIAKSRQTLALLRQRFPAPPPRHARLISQFANIFNEIEKDRPNSRHAAIN